MKAYPISTKCLSKQVKEVQNNMNWLREHTKAATLLAVLLILVIIVVVSYGKIGNSSFLGRYLGNAISVVQEPISSAGNGLKSAAKGIFQFRTVVKENEKLKEEVSSLKREIIGLQLTQAELNELRELSSILNYETVLNNYSLLTADVIAMDGSNWFNIFTINVGSEKGVKEDAAVINGDGLIGRVLEVGRDWAKVISVIDESNSVSFKVLRDMQLLGILSGDGQGGLAGYMLDPDGSVIAGDILVTSGMGMYPEGIVIGKVSEVTWNNDTLLKTVAIEPGVYFKNLQKVTVIIDK